MGAFSIWHILALAVIVLLLFGGRGKISDLMGDVAKGIKSFRQGLSDPEDAKTIPGSASNPAPTPTPNKDQTTVGR
ncbi:MAG TPA: twin-arginine translocase TatA/TatE family subunit [Rhizomicrobium sp.]|nr:twin-arginine translocase TatA/TatE family subunit [Rhizomicrobium sp.]